MQTFTTVKKAIITAICIALCVVLPQAFHAIPNAGSIYLPMHIPVLLCGLVCGWPSGGQAARPASRRYTASSCVLSNTEKIERGEEPKKAYLCKRVSQSYKQETPIRRTTDEQQRQDFVHLPGGSALSSGK